MNIIINGTEYPLATTLRVAYMVQGQFNHKSYSEVFKDLGEMTLEQQISIVYCAFKCANPDQARFLTQQAFLDYYLDNFNLKELMSQLQLLIKKIMGIEDDADIGAEEPAAEGN